jgi:hypothetical protein
LAGWNLRSAVTNATARKSASAHGAQLTDRLLLLGVLHSMGFDFGDNQATESLYAA